MLHRVHFSALLMMDNRLEQWEVASKNKNITGGTCRRSTQHMTLSLTGTTFVALGQEALVFLLSTINQSEFQKENTYLQRVVHFLARFSAAQNNFAVSKMGSPANHTDH